MKLTNLFPKLVNKSEEKTENFLALEVNSETVKAAIWTVEREKIKILKLGSIEEWELEEDLLKAADSTISVANENIALEPSKIIFGLPLDWIEGDKIIPPKKKILINLCDKLNLKPVGFVVSTEALVTYLKLQQGTPPSAILVRLNESEIIVSLVILGKIKDSQKVGRSQDLALDIKEGLARFKNIESLPSRIILFDGLTDFEEAKQQIISYDWLTNLPFLHFPKVESLERDFVMKAIAVAGGGEVAKHWGFQIQPPVSGHKEMDFKGEVTKDQIEDKLNSEDLGFVVQEDTEELPQESKKEDFAVYGVKPEDDTQEISEKTEAISQPEKTYKGENLTHSGIDIGKILRKIWYMVFFPFRIFPKKKLFLMFLPLGLIFIIGVLVWFYLPRAEIILYFSPKTLEKEVSLQLDEKVSSAEISDKNLPAENISTKIDGEKEMETTGEKITGEKAKGNAIVYNKTESSKLFPAGTVLIRGDNIKYVFDEDISIASRSTQTTNEGAEIIWGKATAKISAATFGEEANASAGATFTVKDYSANAYSAKTEAGLSGGSSKKINVIAAKDRETLLEKLLAELEDKGKQKIKSDLPTDRIIIEEGLKTKVNKQEFDKKTGDEGKTLKLKLTLTISTLSFSKDDLNKILMDQFSQLIPSGFTVADSNFQTEISKAEMKSDEKAEVNMKVIANLIPTLDSEKLKKELAGKSNKMAEEYLVTIPDFNRAKINIYPSFLAIFKRLPGTAKNINIEVKVE